MREPFPLSRPAPGTGLRPVRVLAAVLALGGCAHDVPVPLPDAPPPAAWQAPTQPATVDDVVALALAHDPDLVAARAGGAVGAAQARQAAILPNPSLSGAFLPLISGVGTVPAWNVGLTQDIRALVTYRPHVRAARDTAQSVAANVVWQEWQVAGQARQLATDIILAERLRPTAAATVRLLAERNARLEGATAARAATLAELAPARAALQTARSTLATLDQAQLARRQQLNALLGLAPGAALPLADDPAVPVLDPAAIRAALPALPRRRPDLIALQLGYAAAEASVREAILGQFPALVLGGSGASDNSQVINAGPTATIGLPVFDRNQGNIALARATRAQLHAEYAARLAATTGEIEGLLAQIAQVDEQLAMVRHGLPAARAAADRAAEAFAAGAIDARAFADLETNRLTMEQDAMTLETARADRAIAIATLAGIGLPAVAPAIAEPAR